MSDVPPNGKPTFRPLRISWKERRQQLKWRASLDRLGSLDADALDDALNQIEIFLAKRVLTVPQDYLMDDAPADLDWGDVASYEYVEGIAVQRLLLEAFAHYDAKAKSGN